MTPEQAERLIALLKEISPSMAILQLSVTAAVIYFVFQHVFNGLERKIDKP